MNDVMSPDQFVEQMSSISKDLGGDPEMCHIYMDKCICGVLKALGYGDGVEVFEKAKKWYA